MKSAILFSLVIYVVASANLSAEAGSELDQEALPFQGDVERFREYMSQNHPDTWTDTPSEFDVEERPTFQVLLNQPLREILESDSEALRRWEILRKNYNTILIQNKPSIGPGEWEGQLQFIPTSPNDPGRYDIVINPTDEGGPTPESNPVRFSVLRTGRDPSVTDPFASQRERAMACRATLDTLSTFGKLSKTDTDNYGRRWHFYAYNELVSKETAEKYCLRYNSDKVQVLDKAIAVRAE